MRRRTLTGNVAILFFVVSFFCVFVAFSTSSWLVSDYRITGAKFDRLGLWTHCFRSLPDPTDVHQRRFFVGCRWVFDPFTKGYDEIRGFLIPGITKPPLPLQLISNLIIHFSSIYGFNWIFLHYYFYLCLNNRCNGVNVLFMLCSRSRAVYTFYQSYWIDFIRRR